MKKTRILKTLPFICLVLSILFLALSMARSPIGDVEKIADKTESKLAARMEILDTYIRKALETEEGSWPEIGKLPDDMVIYRYVNDSLQSWSNQFAVLNDDISSKLVFQRMSNMMDRIVSPLSEIEETVSYRTIGPIWYVTKSVSGTRNDRIIAGLEVKNTLIDGIRTNENGVNKALKLPNIYSIQPLGYNGGADVSIDGVPLFKVLCETIVPYGFFNNSVLKWISLILFALATILLLASRRTIKVFMGVLASLGVMAVVSFVWAQKMNESMDLFSPTIYADGQYLNSLGVLILTNSFITMLCICLYLIRDRFVALARADRERTRTKMAAYGLAILTTGICIFAYTHITLKSLIMNSNISLELYRLNDNIRYTVLVYLSYTGLFFCLLLHIQALRPVVKRFFGISYNILSRWGILLFALICAFYFTCTSSTLGFRKEVDRVTVWANRLAVDRNLALEIQLRSVEESIANDQLLSALSMLENTAGMLQNRISDNYLSRIRQDNSITVHVYKEDDKTGTENFNTITRSGTPISEGSRFFFLTDGNGRSTYAGTFFFWNKEHGLVRMLLMVEPNSNREDRGYYSILGRFSKPGEINIPQTLTSPRRSKERTQARSSSGAKGLVR